MRLRYTLCWALLFGFAVAASSSGQSTHGFIQSWQARATRTQAEQPHWVTPLATVTPRLEQEFRTDFVRQITSAGAHSWSYGGGKGLELIPARRIELLLNIPPYRQHNSASAQDGFGDFTTMMKYRILAANEHKGNYILTAFFGGSVPTGSHQNGSPEAALLPSLAGGAGIGRFDVQTTLGATLPVSNGDTLGRPVQWNTALQYSAGEYLWPELEWNATYFTGGPNDGRMQGFLTPGLVARFHLHGRLGITLGAGMQIAASRFHEYNHGLIFSARLPF